MGQPTHPAIGPIRRYVRRRFLDPSRRRGLLVAFEGPDGSGKTTQRKLFKRWLKSEGYDVVTTTWNSSDLIHPIIKSRKSIRALNPEEFSLLHSADFRHRVEHTILPALWEGKLVIADRFFFTALARDVSRGLDLEWVLTLYQPLLWPDLVFYFSV
jgi:dTMP kinase